MSFPLLTCPPPEDAPSSTLENDADRDTNDCLARVSIGDNICTDCSPSILTSLATVACACFRVRPLSCDKESTSFSLFTNTSRDRSKDCACCRKWRCSHEVIVFIELALDNEALSVDTRR